MKNSWIIRGALLIVLSAVASGVFYQMEKYPAADLEKLALTPNNAGEFTQSNPPYVYEADVRDPFLLTAPVATSRGHQSRPARPQIWNPPPFGLNGTVLNESKKVAVVQAANGEVFFLSEGDSLQGIIIRKIDKDSVSFTYEGRKTSWRIR